MNGIATMVTQAAIRYLTTVGGVTQWHSIVYRPDEAGVLGGAIQDLYFPKGLSRVFLNVTGRNPGKTHE